MRTFSCRLTKITIPLQTTSADLRKNLPVEFPGVTFYFLPADIVTQILNFGLPAPVDIQIDGADLEANRAVADHILAQIRHVPGIADARIQQDFDYPKFHVSVDRTKAAEGGYTPRDVASSLLVSLSGSFQVTPDVLPQLAERRELQPGGTDAAVRDPVASGSAEYPDQRRRRRLGRRSWRTLRPSPARMKWRC